MEALRVALGERSYPIHIGAGILDASDLYRPHLGSGRVAVISNPVVAPLYLERVKDALRRAGAAAPVEVLVEDGEQAPGGGLARPHHADEKHVARALHAPIVRTARDAERKTAGVSRPCVQGGVLAILSAPSCVR